MVTSRSMTTPVQRGCGTRKMGGVYFESGSGKNGYPLEYFILDRPQLLDAAALGLSDIGVKLIEDPSTGVYHVLDIVGQEHYPNFADFLEEVRRFGLSRRASLSVEFQKLTAESRILIAHKKAYIRNWPEYMIGREHYPRPRWSMGRPDRYFWQCCPHNPDENLSDLRWFQDPPPPPRHDPMGRALEPDGRAKSQDRDFCSGLWWEDISRETPDDRIEMRPEWTRHLAPVSRDVAIRMPSFTYFARFHPEDTEPRHALAIGLVMPLTNFVIVDGADTQKAANRLRECGIVVGDNGDVNVGEGAAERGNLPAFVVKE